MIVRTAAAQDFEPWLALALEVEHLFGPMNPSLQFRLGLAEIITLGNAFCIREEDGPPGSPLRGAIAVLPEPNEIAWLAVARIHQGKGYGKALLGHGLGRLDPAREVCVQTFDPKVEQGLPARQLYLSVGFFDARSAGTNGAGIPTVIMIRRRRT